jgi:2-polyprenyl-6-methoxyphenol hydroxylase-like FAD-dependent oxidoreductase
MNSIKKEVVIIGGGPAGLAAAVELFKKGVRDILIIEREKTLAVLYDLEHYESTKRNIIQY